MSCIVTIRTKNNVSLLYAFGYRIEHVIKYRKPMLKIFDRTYGDLVDTIAREDSFAWLQANHEVREVKPKRPADLLKPETNVS